MKKLIITLVSITLLGAIGCGAGDNDPDAPSKDPACSGLTNKKCDEKKEAEKEKKQKIAELKKKSVETYAKIVYQSYVDSLADAKKLQAAVDTFVGNTATDLDLADVSTVTDENLKRAKQAWRDSRPHYLQTEAYRFYDGPINAYPKDNEVNPKLMGLDATDETPADLETYINAWPLDEAYIDYVVKPADKTTKIKFLFDLSIIGDRTEYPNDKLRSVEAIRATNFKTSNKFNNLDTSTWTPEEKADYDQFKDFLKNEEEDGVVETNTSTGYHAIEFMLWGQDFNDSGPGEQRTASDFTEADFGPRRRIYLKTITDALVQDLQWLVNMWDPGKSDENYLKEFLDPNKVDESFKKAMDGVQQLAISETGGERVAAGLRNHDQEEEHSCFSDNTPVDMYEDVRGMLNVWKGEYEAIDSTKNVEGTGLVEVLKLIDEDAANKLTALLEKAYTDGQNLTDPNEASQMYFDQLIMGDEDSEGYRRVMEFAIDLFSTRPYWKALYTGMGYKENGGIETCVPGKRPNEEGTDCVVCSEVEKTDSNNKYYEKCHIS